MRLSNNKIAHLEEISAHVSSNHDDDLRPREIAEITMPRPMIHTIDAILPDMKKVIYVLGKCSNYPHVIVAGEDLDAKTGCIYEQISTQLYIAEIRDYKTIKKLRLKKK